MQYKPQDGEYLNVVTRDIGVPNNLIQDNVGERTGSQTELQECICRCRNDGKITEP